MKRLLAIVLMIVILIPAIPVSAQAKLPFTDVKGSKWYYDEVCYVYDEGLMNGVEDDSFDPDGSLTRGMFVTILGRMEQIDTSKYCDAVFQDVKPERWYGPYVQWANEKGIVNGYGNGLFGPDDYVTREQMATMMARYLDAKKLEVPESQNQVDQFKDAGTVSKWAKQGVELMRKTGIINGDGGNFRPKDNATRAEAAAIFMRLTMAIVQLPIASELLDENNSIYELTQWHIEYDETEMIHYVDNILLAYVENGLSDEQKEQIAQSVGGKIVGQLNGPASLLQIEVEISTLARLNNLAETLNEQAFVYYATYDVPFNNNQIDISISANVDGKDPTWWYEAVGAGAVHDKYMDFLTSVPVGVVDNVIDEDHPELEGHVSFATTLHNDENIALYEALQSDTTNKKSHGTHVSGLIAAADDGTGITGIAPGFDIVFAPKTTDGGADMDSFDLDSFAMAAYAVNCAANTGAKIINCSYGYGFTGRDKYENEYAKQYNLSYEEFLKVDRNDASEYAKQIAAFTCSMLQNGIDIMIIQSAGNGIDNQNSAGADVLYTSFWAGITPEVFDLIKHKYSVTYEELDSHILVVGGIENEIKNSNYSLCMRQSYGETVDICAPSVDIYSSGYDGSYVYMTGTSMAAPIVSGIAALVWSADPTLSAPEVRQILLDSCRASAVGEDGDTTYTYPVVNAKSAVEAVMKESFDAYKNYIESKYKSYSNTIQFQMVALDGDGIPEVFVNNYDAYTYSILTYDKDKQVVNEFQSRAGGILKYQLRENSFYLNVIFSPYFYDGIYKIQNGNVVLINSGKQNMASEEYTWNGSTVDKDTYFALRDGAFSFDSALSAVESDEETLFSYDEILQWLNIE